MKTFSINEATTQAAFKAAGFSEIKAIFEKKGTVKLSSKEIREALMNDYKFTEGQASGTIRRACQKKLLFSAGNAEYVYNIDFPHSVAEYIAEVNYPHDEEPIPNNAKEESIIDNIKSEIDDLTLKMGTGLAITELNVNDLILMREILNNIKKMIVNDGALAEDIIADMNELEDANLRENVRGTLVQYIEGIEKEINITELLCAEIKWVHEKLSLLKEISK